MTPAPLLQVHALSKNYSRRSGLFRRVVQKALDGVSFTLEAGETIALVGERNNFV